MILYLDTSALVKLIADEAESDEARRAFEAADGAGTSVIAYAEARSALARAVKRKRATRAAAASSRRGLDALWRDLVHVVVDEELSRRAGELAERHLLRGMDALHVAAALTLARDGGEELRFASWDLDRRRAARLEGLSIAPARA